MSLKEQMISDAALFANKDEFAEQVEYEGGINFSTVVARGETNKTFQGTGPSGIGDADEAIISIPISVVAKPKRGERVKTLDDGVIWSVHQVISSDCAIHQVLIVTNVRPMTSGKRLGDGGFNGRD